MTNLFLKCYTCFVDVFLAIPMLRKPILMLSASVLVYFSAALVSCDPGNKCYDVVLANDSLQKQQLLDTIDRSDSISNNIPINEN